MMMMGEEEHGGERAGLERDLTMRLLRSAVLSRTVEVR